MAQPQAPTNYQDNGYGPINSQNSAPDMFSAPDNFINYRNLVQARSADQYYQSLNTPLNMTQAQMFRVLTQPRFSQGVDATQRENIYRLFQRRNDLQRENYSAKLMSESMFFGGSAALAAPVSFMARSMLGAGLAAKIGAGAAGITLPIALLAPIQMSIDKELKRREFAANISTDLDLYRRKIGGDFSYQQNSRLGRELQREMYKGEFTRPGQTQDFFNSEQQMSIFKTGLANGMLDSKNWKAESMMVERGGRIDSSVLDAMRQGGTTTQFKKNFELLRDATKDVVKLLQTTVEGGMSVIKELQQSGFRSIGDIRQQVIQAKAMGDITGIGSQNMMLIGRAGAQAVQGTSWSGQSGATMYQQSATTAALQSQISPSMARAVERAGGIANAGASLASAQMNMLNSGMGTRVVAAMLRSDGSIDPTQMDRMRSGNMSAYEITSRANQIGLGMGQGGRAIFDLTRQKALEQMSDMDRQSLVQRAFDAWRSNKSGNAREQAYVYAGMWTQNPVERELMMENLTTSKQYDKQWAAMQAQNGALNAPVRPTYRNPLSRALSNAVIDIGKGSARLGSVLVNDADNYFGKKLQDISRLAKASIYHVSESLEFLSGNSTAGYGTISRFPGVDVGSTLNKLYGVNATVTGEQQEAMRKISRSDINKYITKSLTKEQLLHKTGIDVESIYKNASDKQYQFLQQELAATVAGTVDPRKLLLSQGTNGSYQYLMPALGVVGSKKYNEAMKDPTKINDLAFPMLKGLTDFAAKQQMYIAAGRDNFESLSTRSGANTTKANTIASSIINDILINNKYTNIADAEKLSNVLSKDNKGVEAYIIGKAVSEITKYRSGSKTPLLALDSIKIRTDIADRAVKDAINSINAVTNQPAKFNEKWINERAPGWQYKKLQDPQSSYDFKLNEENNKKLNKTIAETGNGQLSLPDWASNNSEFVKKFNGDAIKAYKEATSIRTDRDFNGKFETFQNALTEQQASYAYNTIEQQSFNMQTVANKIPGHKGMSDKTRELYVLANSTNPADIAKFKSANLEEVRRAAREITKIEMYSGDTKSDNKDTLLRTIQSALVADKSGARISAETKTVYDGLKSQLDNIALHGSLDKDGKSYTLPETIDKDGKKVKSDPVSVEKFKALKAQMDQLSTNLSASGPASSNGSGINASVAPPVLNYWNNRWVL